MVQFGAHQTLAIRKHLKKFNRTNRIVLVFLSTPLVLLACVLLALHSIRTTEMNAPMLRNTRVTKLRTELIFKTDIKGDIHKKGTQALWDLLVDEAEALGKETSKEMHVMEVGMHRPKECLRAANHGLNVHCMEPSPISSNRILLSFDKATDEHKKGIRFYKTAAGAESGKYVKFQSGGTQGDHVGELMDMWTMTRKQPEKHGQAWLASEIEPFLVKTLALDDIIYNNAKPTIDFSAGQKVDKMFLVKIDTQGYEPEVMEGMKKSIAEQKVDYIITEYWPKGMDFMHNVTAEEKRCEISSNLLKYLSDSGYTLYAMPIVHHPKAPNDAQEFVRPKYANHINFDNYMAHCKFFYELEDIFPSDDYHMGYWTDVLAVAKHARLPAVPTTELGTILKSNQPNNAW